MPARSAPATTTATPSSARTTGLEAAGSVIPFGSWALIYAYGPVWAASWYLDMGNCHGRRTDAL